MSKNLEYLLTGGFLGFGAASAEPVAKAVVTGVKIVGTFALAAGAIWIFLKVKKHG